MKILYVASRYDYGDADRGFSFEHANFYDSFVHMGHEVTYFDFPTLCHELGRETMNERLRQQVQAVRPDLMFTCLTGDELDLLTVRSISESGVTKTLNWFCDDHWRFEKFSRHWAPAFNWVATTASSAVPKYRSLGLTNVIKTQWAANHFQYRRLGLPMKYDMSFVGRVYGRRQEFVERLRRVGINVYTRGYGWPAGRATQEEMIEIFNQSRINLNLADSPKQLNWFKRLTRRKPPPKQIKGRNFEIPGCGGFLLTDPADNLEEYYRPEKEVGLFRDFDDLVEKVRYYLSHETERAAIVQAGYARTLREHTYELRFKEIFRRMNLPDV